LNAFYYSNRIVQPNTFLIVFVVMWVLFSLAA